MALRILAFLILLFSILFLPFWLSAVFAFIGMIYFAVFWEAIPLFLLSDFLYGTKEVKNFSIVFVSLAIFVVLLIIVESLKKKLKFYS
jgi:hypothetical protein